MKQKFIVEQKPFLSLLASMQPICTKRTTMGATNYIMFQVGHKELVLKCTDLEISLQCSYTFKDVSIDTPCSLLIPGKRIFELVKELDGDITFVITNEQLLLQSDLVNLALNSKDAQDFPPFPERIENLMHFDAEFVLEMFSKVAFLIPQNNSNPALNGLYLEISNKELKMTATDGHCLAQVRSSSYSLEEERSWLIPRRAIFEVKKIIEATQDKTVFLGICGNQLVFSGESFNFFTKLLTDKFPEYEAILNRTDFIPAKVDKHHFVKTLKRSSCLLSGQFIATNFSFNSTVVDVSMNNKEVGSLQESLPLENFVGEKMDIRFYAPYLLHGLNSFTHEQLTFYLKNSTKPVIFESDLENSKLLYLVMPVSPTAHT
jgi:DNA polymerase III subunit beta